jgi:virginiamycin A acetyltransferase
VRRLVKNVLHAVFLALAFVPALLSGFGRVEPVYSLFAQAFALAPGIIGDYLRIAYYNLTLEQCPLDSRIQFGSFFSHPQAKVGHGCVYRLLLRAGKNRDWRPDPDLEWRSNP